MFVKGLLLLILSCRCVEDLFFGDDLRNKLAGVDEFVTARTDLPN